MTCIKCCFPKHLHSIVFYYKSDTHKKHCQTYTATIILLELKKWSYPER